MTLAQVSLVTLSRLAVGSLLVTVALACGDATNEPAAGADAIIGGTPARGSALSAVGALRAPSSADGGTAPPGAVPGGYGGLCTATLIAPRLIVTAKHCAARADDPSAPISDSQTLFFTLGPDATKPTRTIRVARTWLVPLYEGGYVAFGSDVAVMQLEDTVDDVAPLRVADGQLAS